MLDCKVCLNLLNKPLPIKDDTDRFKWPSYFSLFLHQMLYLWTDTRKNGGHRLGLEAICIRTEKHMARQKLEPRTSRIPCKHSEHWATEPQGRHLTISPCLIRFVSECARNHAGTDETVPLLLAARARTPTLADKCHRGGKSTWPDRESNPGPLVYRARTLTTELPSHTVDPWHIGA